MVLQDNEPSIRDLDTASTIVDAEEPVLCEGGPVFNDVLMPEFIKQNSLPAVVGCSVYPELKDIGFSAQDIADLANADVDLLDVE